MNRIRDEKWLDELISRTINTAKPQFDAEKWKEKHRREFELLKSRASRMPSIIRPTVWDSILKSRLSKLAAAAVLIVTVGLFVVRWRPHPQVPPVARVAESPAKIMTMISLTRAYRHGGMDAMDRQFDRALEMSGPRSASISVGELLEDLDG
jgi:hypothetical protein